MDVVCMLRDPHFRDKTYHGAFDTLLIKITKYSQ